MSAGKLATALIIIFAVSILVLAAELLFLLWRRRTPISGHFPTSDSSSSKNLLHFFYLKSQTRVEPSEAPTQNGPQPEDHVIDVFKLLQENGPSRVLCTIKEDDREEVESTSMSRVDSVEIITSAESERVSLRACLESEAAVENEMALKTAMSSPCDSPMFFTPVGSPPRDGI